VGVPGRGRVLTDLLAAAEGDLVPGIFFCNSARDVCAEDGLVFDLLVAGVGFCALERREGMKSNFSLPSFCLSKSATGVLSAKFPGPRPSAWVLEEHDFVC
jgi:hypothetical protein